MNDTLKEFLAWWVPWEPSVTLVVCVVVASVLYIRGARRAPRTAPWPRQLAWWIGLLMVYVGLHTHLDYYAEHQFFMHRLQHLLLHHMGPFLMVWAYPGTTLRQGLPLAWRRRLQRAVAWTPIRWTLNVLLHPFVASVLFVGLIYFWLWPSLHFVAMLDVFWYRVMNWSVMIDGLLFWWLVLDHRPRPPARLAPGVRVLVALAVVPPQIILGAYITFARHDLYPIYAICGRAFLGMSVLTDQYLGGLILWIPSSMMCVVAALLAFRHWLLLDKRGRLPKRTRVPGQVHTR